MTLLVGSFVTCSALWLATEAESGTVTASWYGGELEGAPTASGEPFRASGYTAASKTLPLHSRLKVCRDGCVDVRVTDRGPHVAGRELDLSEAAAEKIGVKDEGVAEVTVSQTSSEPVVELPRTGGIGQ